MKFGICQIGRSRKKEEFFCSLYLFNIHTEEESLKLITKCYIANQLHQVNIENTHFMALKYDILRKSASELGHIKCKIECQEIDKGNYTPAPSPESKKYANLALQDGIKILFDGILYNMETVFVPDTGTTNITHVLILLIRHIVKNKLVVDAIYFRRVRIKTPVCASWKLSRLRREIHFGTNYLLYKQKNCELL
ncbi:unnamed protein product [Callosobruchus maculatus]|uniref:Uncharacterized protein n=1 Tax=Callosobruchus maculatus TaxID=64391 RepID=A0A653BRF2_CALMS|nr:unnamed protein product [Callosobruchus maculatus]